MTLQEAIKILEMEKTDDEWNYPLNYAVAIDVVLKALEKQMPEKPEKEGNDLIICPECGSFLGHAIDCEDEAYQSPHCEGCGQAIDWSEGE